MTDSWRDVKWWIAIGVTIAFSVLSILYSYGTRETKRLTIQSVANAPIVSRQPSDTPMLLLIGERQVPQAFSRVLEIRNSGSQPILTRDFDVPVTLRFGNNAIISARVSATNPSGLAPQIHIAPSRDQLTLEPLLLNPTDSLTIEMLVTDASMKNVGARIAGIKRLDVIEESAKPPVGVHVIDVPLGFLVLALGGIMYIGGLWFPSRYTNVRRFELLIGGMVAVIAGLQLLDDTIMSYFVHHYSRHAFAMIMLAIVTYLGIVIAAYRLLRPRETPDSLIATDHYTHQGTG